MQDKYVGDIGDYGKFGLLRYLFVPPQWRLGIVWYLVPNEPESKDGRHTGYLDDPRTWQSYDPHVFDELRRIVSGNRRWASAINVKELIGKDTVSFLDKLTFERIEGKEERTRVRNEWIGRAVAKISACNAVFLDPDNGIEAATIKRHEKAGPKYAFLDEIATLISDDRVGVIYHHLGREEHSEAIRRLAARLQAETGRAGLVIALRFNRISCRAYFVLATKQTQHELESRIEQFLKSSWGDCFDQVKV